MHFKFSQKYIYIFLLCELKITAARIGLIQNYRSLTNMRMYKLNVSVRLLLVYCAVLLSMVYGASLQIGF